MADLRESPVTKATADPTFYNKHSRHTAENSWFEKIQNLKQDVNRVPRQVSDVAEQPIELRQRGDRDARKIPDGSTLYNFTGADNGCSPSPNVIFGKPESRQLYGVATSCGANGNGTVFTVKK